MKILAIETTERTGGVALADHGNLLLEIELDHDKRSTESLAPAIRAALDAAGWHTGDIDLVATTVGPGSFTGLRVGVTTAKTFAYCAGAEVLGLDTLDTIASAVPPDVREVAVAVDAQRADVVAAEFSRDADGRMRRLAPAVLIPWDAWLTGIPSGTAVASPLFVKRADTLPGGLTLLAPEFWRPTAGAVARLAAQHYAEGRRDDLWTLAPHYSRRSAAEEKRESR